MDALLGLISRTISAQYQVSGKKKGQVIHIIRAEQDKELPLILFISITLKHKMDINPLCIQF